MRISIKATAIAALLAAGAAGAHIAAPEGWRKESFRFPLQFAPSIPYEGEEHVRFAPYWTDFAADRGFSYVILWDVKRRPLQPQSLERALMVYFDGLMEAVTKARKLEDPGTVSAVSLHPMKPPAGWSEAFGGRVFTWNGFSRGEPLALHMEVVQRDCGEDRMHVFFVFSKAPRDRPPWDELRAIRDKTAC